MPIIFPTSPTVGQVFTSGGRSWVWNGSTWDSPSSATAALSGLTHIRTVSFTGVASVSLDNVFSSVYDNYKVLIVARNSSDANRTWSLKFRVNGADATSGLYNLAANGIDRIGNAQNTFSVNATSAVLLNNSYFAEYRSVVSFDLCSPFLTDDTNGVGVSVGLNSTHSIHQSFSFSLFNNASYDGVSIINSSGNFTNGTIEIYGYRKA
jgi:hypothetical protein